MRGPAALVAPRPGLPAVACPVDATECVAGVSGDDAEEGVVEEQEGCKVSERDGGGKSTQTARPAPGCWMLSNKRLERLLAQVSALEAADDPTQLSLFLSGLSEVDRSRLAAALASTHQPQRPPDIQEHQAVSALQSSLHQPRGLGLHQADSPPQAPPASLPQPSNQLQGHGAAADAPEAAALFPSASPMSQPPPPLPRSQAAVPSPSPPPALQREYGLAMDRTGADQVRPDASPPAAAASNSLQQALRRIAVQINRQKASLDRLGVSCTPPGQMLPGERHGNSKTDDHAASSLRVTAGALAERGQADAQDHPTLKTITSQAERAHDRDLHGGVSVRVSGEARSRPPASGGGTVGHEPDEPSPPHVGAVLTPPTSHGPPATSDAPAPRQRQTPPPQVRALSLSGVSLVPVRPSPLTPHLNTVCMHAW